MSVKKAYIFLVTSIYMEEEHLNRIMGGCGEALSKTNSTFSNLYYEMVNKNVPVVSQAAYVSPFNYEDGNNAIAHFWIACGLQEIKKENAFIETGSGLHPVTGIKYDFMFSYYFVVSDVSHSEGCFIATATYGNYDHPIVKDFRLFRDNVLKNSFWGRIFIKTYYKSSPFLSRIIEHNHFLKNI